MEGGEYSSSLRTFRTVHEDGFPRSSACCVCAPLERHGHVGMLDASGWCPVCTSFSDFHRPAALHLRPSCALPSLALLSSSFFVCETGLHAFYATNARALRGRKAFHCKVNNTDPFWRAVYYGTCHNALYYSQWLDSLCSGKAAISIYETMTSTIPTPTPLLR